MQYFNIQVASQLSGVATATIRAWEKRYNAVVPERSENKHRLYSETDIEKLAVLHSLTELGQSIGNVAHLQLTILKEVYTRLMHRPYEEKNVVTFHHEKIDSEKIVATIILALSSYKVAIISHELEKARTSLSPRDLCLKVLIPLFSSNELTTSQEQILNQLIKFHFGQLIEQHYQTSILREKLILITTPEGEMGDFEILAVALLCIHYGLKIIYFGASLPAKSFAETINMLYPKAIILGISHQLNLNEYLDTLAEKMVCHPNIIITGNLIQQQASELEKKNIFFFPTLDALDIFLSKF